MTPEQLPLALSTERREKKRGHVPRTSVEAYEKSGAGGRARNVLRLLKDTPIDAAYTSAELTDFAVFLDAPFFRTYRFQHQPVARLLYVRRGLSDLLAKNIVEHVPHGERVCRVTGRKSVTWRVKGR